MKVAVLAAGAALGLALVSGAQASTALVAGSGWQSFLFGGVGSSWSTDYTFTVGAGGATLKVTDAFLAGDRFSVGDAPAGTNLGNTSVPTGYGQQIGANYDAAYASPLWSHGVWYFGAGSYDITGTAIVSPFGGGGAAVELSSGVPEPSTWALMGLGFAGLAFAGLRGRRSTVAAA